jgi:hypothetical protein
LISHVFVFFFCFVLQLVGFFQRFPQGGHETPLPIFNEGFGYTIDLYDNFAIADFDGSLVIMELQYAPLNGDEHRSEFWMRADTSK